MPVRIAPGVLERLGESRRANLLGAARVVQSEEVSLGTCGPFAWAELFPRFRHGAVVRLTAWGASDLLAFTDPRAPGAVIADAQPELPDDLDSILAVLALCELRALVPDDVAAFYDGQRMQVSATTRLRDEFEPPHLEGAAVVYLSHRRRQGDIVRVHVDVRSFTVSCDVLGSAGELHPALRAPR